MALDIFAEFATDESLENNGAWRDIGKGTKLLVARNGNPAYHKLINEQTEQHQEVLENGSDKAKEDQWVAITIYAAARALLLGWENLDYMGKPYGEYTVPKAEKLLRHRDFRIRVLGLSNEQEAYRAKLEVVQGEV